jgi:hypothetical protein
MTKLRMFGTIQKGDRVRVVNLRSNNATLATYDGMTGVVDAVHTYSDNSQRMMVKFSDGRVHGFLPFELRRI